MTRNFARRFLSTSLQGSLPSCGIKLPTSSALRDAIGITHEEWRLFMIEHGYKAYAGQYAYQYAHRQRTAV